MVLRQAKRRLLSSGTALCYSTGRVSSRAFLLLGLPRSYSISSRRQQDVQPFQSQLDDPVASSFMPALKSTPPSKVPQTLTEKLVQAAAVGLPEDKFVQSGDYVTLEPAHCMTHDNTWPVATKFFSIGASKIHNPRQIVMTLDHDVQNKSETNLKKYRQIEEFAKNQGVDFYPAGRGIGHQIMVEEGYAFPNTMVVASDSHSNMYGGVSCLGTPIVRTDACSIYATGKTWWQIPPIAKVTLTGVLPKGVTGKDVIVALCGLFSNDEILNHAIEFVGSPETLATLPIDDRLAIANMTTEWGALSGLFPLDSVLKEWLRGKVIEAAMYDSQQLTPGRSIHRFSQERVDNLLANPTAADPGAKYAKHLYLNLSTLSPYVSGPNSVKKATAVDVLEAENIKVDRAYLVSCTNSRSSDIAAAARVFRDAAKASSTTPATSTTTYLPSEDLHVPRIPEHVNFYIAAASHLEQLSAEAQGDWQILLAAGAQPLLAGCGPCIGLGAGLLEPGEVGISASNRNFKGRMGSTEAKAYLASPEVVAASALKGRIAGPGIYAKPEGWTGVEKGEGNGSREVNRTISIEDALDRLVQEAENLVAEGEKGVKAPSASKVEATPAASTENRASIIDGFPEKISGEIVYVPIDNCNTDAIYPGKYTYQDGITKAKMAEVVMQNYDPAFASVARQGDVLASGFNFGCGSSREQAATAILAKGIPLVAAGSFGNIFARNSINNALLGIEVPELARRLREVFAPAGEAGGSGGKAPLTIRTGWRLEWDVRGCVVRVVEKDGKSWERRVGEMPPNVQAIVARGGLEGWVKAEISRQA